MISKVIPVSIDIEKDKKDGGVSLHIRKGITFILRHDLDYFDSIMETDFIEINKCIFDTDSNIVIGVIYRMPNSSVGNFNDRISDVMKAIQTAKTLLFVGRSEHWLSESWIFGSTDPLGSNPAFYILPSTTNCWLRQ